MSDLILAWDLSSRAHDIHDFMEPFCECPARPDQEFGNLSSSLIFQLRGVCLNHTINLMKHS